MLWYGADAQEISIYNEDGQAMMGVQVYNKDYSYTAVSDDQGRIFVASKLGEEEVLVFTYLGYDELEMNLKMIRNLLMKVTMTPVDHFIDEVVVYGRKEVSQQELPYQIATIKARDIAATQSQTSADALAYHGGVYVQKSQMGGGSPLIRGFEANRVLLVIDGVRLNNAIFRSGHLQNAITIDQAILEKMDVIFGPNSLMYGSDALGGVVHFITRSPKLSFEDGIRSELGYSLRHATANNEKSVHADISIGSRKFGSLTSISFSKFGDLKTGNHRDIRFPDFGKRFTYQSNLYGVDNSGEDIEVQNKDPNIQVGTGYHQADVTQKFLLVPNEFHRLTANIHYSTSSDVPRYDNLTERSNGGFKWGEWAYGPQNRFLGSIDYRNLKANIVWDDIAIITAIQKIKEDRITRRWQAPERSFQNENVTVYSLTADASKYVTKNKSSRIEYGFDIQINELQSSAVNVDLSSGRIIPNQLTRYASGGNNYSSLGGYITLTGATARQRLHYNTGVRFSTINYNLNYKITDPVDWPSSFYNGINGNNSALTWSMGGTWQGESGWNIRSMISTAFRSPNIDDLAKIRINNDEITFPNLDLSPEKSINLELTLAKEFRNKMKVTCTAFYTNLSDAIVRKKGLGPSGESLWFTQGDTLNIVTNQNAEKAFIYGFNANFLYFWGSSMSVKGSLNYTKGRERLDNDETAPFAHIPPLYGQVSFNYKKTNWNINGSWRFNGMKPANEYGGSVDNLDLATPIGALRWSTFNLYSSYDLSDEVRFSVAMENILDKHYRPFGSGVSSAGRNFIFSVSGKF